MGWDAFAEPFSTNWNFEPLVQAGAVKEGSREWDGVEEAVRERIRAAGGRPTVDGLLRHGGLDCSDCAEMLERATLASCWIPEWSPAMVRGLAQTASWDFEVEPDLLWAKESARAFLEHAAKLGKSIRFSW